LAATPPPDLLGDWPATLLGKVREGLPEEHALRHCADGDLTAIMEQARQRLEAALADRN
jgi:hypothetical protein